MLQQSNEEIVDLKVAWKKGTHKYLFHEFKR